MTAPGRSAKSFALGDNGDDTRAYAVADRDGVATIVWEQHATDLYVARCTIRACRRPWHLGSEYVSPPTPLPVDPLAIAVDSRGSVLTLWPDKTGKA
ncbi:MAG: hypothetical protein V9E83_06865 [Baekduia sp.]